jgi:hypothetical protein
MNSELKRIETSVNVFVGKPVTWLLYGLVLATRHGSRQALRFVTWLRHRCAAWAAKA